MAPVDDHIAKARLEKQKTTKQGIDSLAGPTQEQDQCGKVQGYTPQETKAYRPTTMAEEADKRGAYHVEEYEKASRASSFLTAHPEFEDFIRLVRSGAIQFTLLALVAVAALAQADPTLSTADRVALQALETQKQAAQKQYQEATQAEITIEQEFSKAHAGYHVNPQSFIVEKDALPTPHPEVHAVRPTPPAPQK